MAATPFKCIVVGCGPSGLAAAHALSLAGIDFVVLERGTELFKDNGATFVLWSHAHRVLAQMGLWDRIKSLEGSPLLNSYQQTWKGKVYKQNDSTHMEELFGSHTVMYSRYRFLREMHDALSATDKARILTGKHVENIETTDTGVIVTCEDGSIHNGSIVIGADGIYSRVRRFMREIPLSEPVEKELPFEAEFKCVWFSVPQDGRIPSETVRMVNGKGTNGHVLAGKREVWILIYERLEKVVKGRVRYSDQDQNAFVEKWGHLKMTDKLTLKDFWPMRTAGGMTNLDEGILDTAWHRGRIVLVGDAKHKMTPHMGLGFTNGIVDLVVITNALHSALQASPTNGTGALSTEQISNIFRHYEEVRRPEVEKDSKLSMQTTRLISWHTPIAKVFDRYLLPKVPMFLLKSMVGKSLGPMMDRGRTLDFVDHEEIYPMVEKKWKNPMDGNVKKEATTAA